MPTKKVQIIGDILEGAVRYDKAQTLTEEQKIQIKENLDVKEAVITMKTWTAADMEV